MLKKILADKKEELETVKRRLPLKELKAMARDLPDASDFRQAISRGGVTPPLLETNIIAEIKKASPSKGIICADFNLLKIAHIYEDNGARAISVLTEKNYFLGEIEYLKLLKKEIHLPLLRKDFILEEYQIYESAVFGADAILLIAAILENSQIRDFSDLSQDLGREILFEVHSSADIEKGKGSSINIYGINNRNLETFKTDISTTAELIPEIPPKKTIVSESGINTTDEINRLKTAGAHAFLIGETLMREKNIADKLKEFTRTN